MLSVSKPMPAGQASGYFEQDDYYLQEGGTWIGKGASRLGLTGQVEKDAFNAVCQGAEPFTGDLLVQHKGGEDRMEHRAGIDLTFSPPKSVSIGALTDPIHKELHDQAVERVVDYVEKNLVHARVTEGGETEVVNTSSMVAAKFDHMISRELDPQLHSHIFLANMTSYQGKWRATNNDAIYRAQKFLGRIYDNELMHLYKVQGFGVEITNRDKGTWELTAIPKELIEEFSKRRDQVMERYEQLKERQVAEGLYINKSDSWLRKKAVMDTRQAKAKDIDKGQLLAWWAEDFANHGYTLDSLRQAIEAERTPVGQLKIDPIDHKEFADEALMRAGEVLHARESAFTRADLIHAAMVRSHGEHSLESLNTSYWSLRDSKNGLVSLDTKRDRYGVEVEMITTRNMLDIERRVVEQAEEGIGGFLPVSTREEVEKFINTKEVAKTGEMVEAGKLQQGEQWCLTDDQRRYVLEVLTGKDNVLLVDGDPGTGKTAAREMIEAFNSEVIAGSGRRQQITLSVATMGRAAAEVSSVTGGLAETIDRFLSKDYEVADPDKLWQMMQTQSKTVWLPKGAAIEVLVEEASMVCSRHFGMLTDLAERWRQEFRTNVKITFSGDHKQMPSIGAGKLFAELLDKTATTQVKLKKIIRQKEGTYAHQVSVALNHEQDTGRALQILRDNSRLHEISDRDELISATIGKYLEVASNGKSSFVITALNTDRKELNDRIRAELVKSGKVEEGREFVINTSASNIGIKMISADNYAVGQVVLYTGNESKKDGIKYGSEGIITAINPDNNTVTVKYGKGKEAVEIGHSLKRDWNKMSVYDKEIRSFGIGDEVIFTRNHSGMDVHNGDRGRVVATEGNKLIVELHGGKYKREVTVRLSGRNPYQYLDHAYAITVRKSQGATVDEAIGFLHVRPSAVLNSQKELQEVGGVEISKGTYKQLNTTISEAEHSWRSEGTINSHRCTITVGVANIGRTEPELNKVVEVSFLDSKSIIGDEETRKLMRGAGMFYRDGYWLTALTNKSARELIGSHPLKDQQYLQVLRSRATQLNSKERDESAETEAKDARDIGEAERRYAETYFQVFNTMATRGRGDFSIFTNDIDRLSNDMKRWQNKESTLVGPGLKVRRKGDEKMGQIIDYDEKSDKVAVEYNKRSEGKTVQVYSLEELRDSGGRELYMTNEERRAAGGKRTRLFGLGGISAEYNWDANKVQMVDTMEYGNGQYETIKVGDAKIDSFVRSDRGIFTATRTVTRKNGTKIKIDEYGIRFAGQLFGYRRRSEIIKSGPNKGNRKISTVYNFGKKYWGTTTFIDWIGDKQIETWRGRIKGGLITPRRLVVSRVDKSEGMTVSRKIMGCLQTRMEKLVDTIERLGSKAFDQIRPAQLSPREALQLLKPGPLSRLVMSAEERHRRENMNKAAAVRVTAIEYQELVDRSAKKDRTEVGKQQAGKEPQISR